MFFYGVWVINIWLCFRRNFDDYGQSERMELFEFKALCQNFRTKVGRPSFSAVEHEHFPETKEELTKEYSRNLYGMTDSVKCQRFSLLKVVVNCLMKTSLYLQLYQMKYFVSHKSWELLTTFSWSLLQSIDMRTPLWFPCLRSVMPIGSKARSYRKLIRVVEKILQVLFLPQELWKNKTRFFKTIVKH